MVSALWNAASEGRIDDVHELLQSASAVEIEIKDHTGATPLIQAVKNNHIEIVRVLLQKGADPFGVSSPGPPEQYTSDLAILDLIRSAQVKSTPDASPYHVPYVPDTNSQSEKPYYDPSAPYPYYPTFNGHPVVPEGTVYYPPPPSNESPQVAPGGIGNLPPPDIAKQIPCRYFPACRYGSSCIFMHPTGPYFQGSLPHPAQYPAHYDAPAYPSTYYPVSPSFQAPPLHPLASPVSSPGHVRSTSDLTPHFNPVNPANTAPYTLPYGPLPMPMSVPPPPLPAQYPPNQQTTAHLPLLAPSQDLHVPPVANINTSPVVNGVGESSPVGPEVEGVNHTSHPRDAGTLHGRRGSAALRRGSFPRPGRPPCMFFPSGRCKNGSDCRFAHVTTENGHHPLPSFPPGRGKGRGGAINGHSQSVEDKLAGLNMRDDQTRVPNGTAYRPNGIVGSRYPLGMKNSNTTQARKPPVVKQRVPEADEFPTLNGATTPPRPLTNGVNGHAGPTAAQVLQAPAPTRRDSSKDQSPRESNQPLKEANSDSVEAFTPKPVSVTFASIANGTVSDTIKEVSVSA